MWWPFKKKRKSKNFELLAKSLKERREKVFGEFKERHKFTLDWAKERGLNPEELVQRSARGLAATVAAGAVLLSSSVPLGHVSPKEVKREAEGELIKSSVKARRDVSDQVKEALAGEDLYNEREVAKKLGMALKIPVTQELDGIRLNTTYGIMGYESHLTRYPGDNISTHFQTNQDYRKFGRASMAGGPGAWGYIAPSKEALTAKDIDREKYYLVAQTFLSPQWGSAEVKEWFRHRKMVVVNPRNGEVVVGVLEDAGPEESTGRSFGGSPEVMEVLGFEGGGAEVLMYFVDDPKDKIPLGPYGL